MNNPLLDVFKGNNRSIPIWIMRQAGRYLPEYQSLRKNFSSIFDMIMDPDVASQVSLMPIKRFNMDASVIFSDILVLFYVMGIDVRFIPNAGPFLEYEDISVLEEKLSLSQSFTQKLEPVFENIRKTRKILPPEKSVIGFSGSPFTLCCYLLEKSGSHKGFLKAKEIMYGKPELFDSILEKVSILVAEFLIQQIKSGCDVVQMFDSHSHVVSGDDFSRYVISPTQRVIREVKKVFPDTPIIGFPRGSGLQYVDYVQSCQIDAISVDQFVPVSWIKKNLSHLKVVQGNLDPSILSANIHISLERTKNIISQLAAETNKGFIFNLGHGILPTTKVEHLGALVNYVKGIQLPISPPTLS